MSLALNLGLHFFLLFPLREARYFGKSRRLVLGFPLTMVLLLVIV